MKTKYNNLHELGQAIKAHQENNFTYNGVKFHISQEWGGWEITNQENNKKGIFPTFGTMTDCQGIAANTLKQEAPKVQHYDRKGNII